MPLSEQEARRRLKATLVTAAPDVALDPASVQRVESPYPGISYGLQLGEANALLFLPLADIEGDGWEQRLADRLRSAHDYMQQFPLSHVRR